MEAPVVARPACLRRPPVAEFATKSRRDVGGRVAISRGGPLACQALSSARQAMTFPAPSLIACVLAAGLAAGCQMRGDVRPLSSEAPPPPVFAPPPESCQAAAVRFALGRQITAPLLEEMRSRAGARSARTAGAADPAMPVDLQRLIVDIDPTGRIVGLRCG